MGGEKMSLKEALKENLGWSSPIGIGIFFMGTGILVWGAMTALAILTNL
jgi:hypothetical protein